MDKLDLLEIGNEFESASEHRQKTSGKFLPTDHWGFVFWNYYRKLYYIVQSCNFWTKDICACWTYVSTHLAVCNMDDGPRGSALYTHLEGRDLNIFLECAHFLQTIAPPYFHFVSDTYDV